MEVKGFKGLGWRLAAFKGLGWRLTAFKGLGWELRGVGATGWIRRNRLRVRAKGKGCFKDSSVRVVPRWCLDIVLTQRHPGNRCWPKHRNRC